MRCKVMDLSVRLVIENSERNQALVNALRMGA
jgi:hypothetical protein